ncbi:MAG: hypothetical protein FWH26_04780 [Oscillospiraceae bacterium]|nr:hypothetical protein [Oscillospiraceae bacterium]
MTEQSKRRTHRWAFPVGLVLVLLAVVGAVTLVSGLVRGIQYRIDNPKDKLDYENFLKIIVMHDPDPFDDVDTAANIPQLLDISIWSLQNSGEAAPKDYPMDDMGNLRVPQEDVEREFLRLFGKNVPLHATIEGMDYTFEYDAQNKCYLIPTTGSLQIYVPRVRDIDKVGNSIKLLVDYLPYGTGDWRLDESGVPGEPEPAKTMLITLFVSGDSYTVGAIQLPPGQLMAAEGQTRIA